VTVRVERRTHISFGSSLPQVLKSKLHTVNPESQVRGQELHAASFVGGSLHLLHLTSVNLGHGREQR